MTDVAVVGSGPNGLAAAVTMARAGLKVHVFEAAATPGGGLRTAELMEPGHFHDVCSAVHPMVLASPFFRRFELSRRVPLEVPELSYGSPLDGGRAALAYRSLDRTVAELGRDGAAYRQLMEPLVRRVEGVADLTLNQLLRIPADPLAAAAFGLRALEQGSPLWNARFSQDLAPALLSGVAAHAVAPLPSITAAGAGLMLGALGHAGGWPVPRGGSAAIAQALTADIEAHGGVVETGRRITSLAELPPARATLLDVAPPALLHLAEGRLPPRYRSALASFRFGNASCKVDFILSGPVPWAATRPRRCRDGARGRHQGGNRRSGAPGRLGTASGPALRAGIPALAFRCRPRAGRPAHPVDLLPRSGRFHRGHERCGHGATGALRARVPGCGGAVQGDHGRRAGGVRRELRRWGLRRRPHGPLGHVAAAGAEPGALADAAARGVLVLVVDPARSRRHRDARLPRRPACPQGHVRSRRSRTSDTGSPAASP